MPNDLSLVVSAVALNFKTFGGGVVRDSENPIALATKDEPPKFALGVDVEEVVRFVLNIAGSQPPLPGAENRMRKAKIKR